MEVTSLTKFKDQAVDITKSIKTILAREFTDELSEYEQACLENAITQMKLFIGSVAVKELDI